MGGSLCGLWTSGEMDVSDMRIVDPIGRTEQKRQGNAETSVKWTNYFRKDWNIGRWEVHIKKRNREWLCTV